MTMNIQDIETICNSLQTIRNDDVIIINRDSQEQTLFDELKTLAASHGLENDSQTQLFLTIIATSAGNATVRDAERFKKFIQGITLLSGLLSVIAKEVEEFRDLTAEFYSIQRQFCDLILDIQQLARRMRRKFDRSVFCFDRIEQLIKPSLCDEKTVTCEFDDNRKDAILECFRMLGNIAEDFVKSANEDRLQMNEFQNKLQLFMNKVQEKRGSVKNRTRFSKAIRFGSLTGAIAGGGIVGTCVGVPSLGGAGALVLGGTVFWPVGAIVGGMIVVAVVVAGLGCLIEYVRSRYDDHQQRAEGFLNNLESNMKYMLAATSGMKHRLDSSISWTEGYQDHLQQIIQTVTHPIYVEANKKIFDNARKAAITMGESFKELSEFDFIEWNKNLKPLKYK